MTYIHNCECGSVTETLVRVVPIHAITGPLRMQDQMFYERRYLTSVQGRSRVFFAINARQMRTNPTIILELAVAWYPLDIGGLSELASLVLLHLPFTYNTERIHLAGSETCKRPNRKPYRVPASEALRFEFEYLSH